jgi:hypothetical protein
MLDAQHGPGDGSGSRRGPSATGSGGPGRGSGSSHGSAGRRRLPARRASRTAAVTLAGLALLAAAGCSTAAHRGPAEPRTVVQLPAYPTATPAATTVTLKAHESFAVRHVVQALPKTWAQTSAGDGRVLHKGPSVTVSPCPARQAGCGTPTDDVYTAASPGTTTVLWSFGTLGHCTPATGPACTHITKTIRVIVK